MHVVKGQKKKVLRPEVPEASQKISTTAITKWLYTLDRFFKHRGIGLIIIPLKLMPIY